MVELTHPRATSPCIGHEPALKMFERAMQNGRLPHGWALIGPPGIGKATLAYALVRRLLARPGEAVDDKQSAIFRQIAQASHPDFQTLERRPHPKTGKMQSEIVVDAVREAIDSMHRTTAWNGRRVLLIDSIDELNRNAENALLKVLEEPVAGTVILLVCHAPGSVPRTILSRCAQMPLRAPDLPVADRILQSALPELDAPARNALLAFVDFAPGRAVQIHSFDLLAFYGKLLDACLDKGPVTGKAFGLAEHLTKLASDAGVALAVEPLAQLARRAAWLAGEGELKQQAIVGEFDKLQALAASQPLEHWLAMWEKLCRLPTMVDGLNLDIHTSLFTNLRALMGEKVREPAL